MTERLNMWPPTPGFYAMPLVRRGPEVPVRIWFGPAVIDGEEQDRGPDWHAEIDGRTDEQDRESDVACRVPLSIDRAWPFCARHPITETEYRFLLRRREWAHAHAPEHPAARPFDKVDVGTLKPAF